MKDVCIYQNLERQLKLNDIEKVDLMKILGVNQNAITQKLNGGEIITFNEAIIIRDYLKNTSGTNFELEYLFRKD